MYLHAWCSACEQRDEGRVPQAVPLRKGDCADVLAVMGCKLDERVVLLGLADGGALAWWELKGQGGGDRGDGVAPGSAGAHGSDAIAGGVHVAGNVDDELCRHVCPASGAQHELFKQLVAVLGNPCRMVRSRPQRTSQMTSWLCIGTSPCCCSLLISATRNLHLSVMPSVHIAGV